MQPLRQISDTILHTPVPSTDLTTDVSKLRTQYELMQAYVRETGITGLAANQCVEFDSPCNMMIIGTNSDKFREMAAQRYPGQKIPHETLMINPKIINSSKETYFPKTGEGCGSVESTLRAKLKRHLSVEVEYQSLDGETHRETYHQLAANVIQHEVEHLQGIVYLQKLYEEMSQEQLQQLITLTQDTIANKSYRVGRPFDMTKRDVTFDRDSEGSLLIHEDYLRDGLKEALLSTLQGILVTAEKAFSGKQTSASAMSA